MIHVFTMADPRDAAIRYVGVSTDVAKHVAELCLRAGKALSTGWLVEVLDAGLMPVVQVRGGWSTQPDAQKHRSEVVSELIRQGEVLASDRRSWRGAVGVAETSQDTIHPFTTEPFLLEYELLPPVGRRKPWTQSRLAKVEDGTTVPVLRLLALEKFGPWREAERTPYWKDRDWRNETLDNVEMLDVVESTGIRKVSAFGVPAGSKPYLKAWREANPEKVKAAQKRYREKRAALLREVRRPTDPGSPVALDPEPENPLLKKMERLIDTE
jgi:hypothetical protein